MQTLNRLSRCRRDMFHYKWNAINTARLQIEQNIRAYRAQLGDMFHYKWNAINTARLQIEQNIRAYRAQLEP